MLTKNQNNNKYYKWYFQIVNHRLHQLPQNQYTERHHIIPRSLFGSDHHSNLVHLTSREHFICHALLCKMFNTGSKEWYKMNHAFMMMKCSSTNQQRYINSRIYESLRKNFPSIMSNAQSGHKNSQFDTVWVTNFTLLECKRIPKNDLNHWLSLGYIQQRIINFDSYINKQHTLQTGKFKKQQEKIIKNI